MDKFRQSRRQSTYKRQPKQPFISLPNISPEKRKQEVIIGQGSQSPYRTSRPQSFLQKQAIAARKYQQAQQRLREKQVAYRHLTDLYDKVVKQKQGIESSLQQQIEMYRNLIKEIQQKASQRLKQVQKAFKQQMQRKLQEKQRQAEIMQAEKQQLEDFVAQLQKIGDQLQAKLNYTTGDLKNTQQILRKTEDQKKNFIQKLQAAQQYSKAQNQKYQQIVDNLKEQAISSEREWRDKIDQAGKQKQKALKQQQKQLKHQINKIQQKHEVEKVQRKQQIKNLIQSFESQKNRLNQVITTKQKAIQQHHKLSKQGNDKLNNAIRGYQQQIQSLASQKARLFEEVDSLNSQNTHLNVLIKQLQLNSANQKKNLEAYILKLKDQMNFSQSNFLRERDRNILTYEDSSKQITALKRQMALLQAQYQKLKQKQADNQVLTDEVRKLRDMLLQSSYQLQKCKGQYIRISKDRQMMALKLNQSCYEIGALRKIKYQREDQARGWRDSYYLSRSRSIRR